MPTSDRNDQWREAYPREFGTRHGPGVGFIYVADRERPRTLHLVVKLAGKDARPMQAQCGAWPADQQEGEARWANVVPVPEREDALCWGCVAAMLERMWRLIHMVDAGAVVGDQTPPTDRLNTPVP